MNTAGQGASEKEPFDLLANTRSGRVSARLHLGGKDGEDALVLYRQGQKD